MHNTGKTTTSENRNVPLSPDLHFCPLTKVPAEKLPPLPRAGQLPTATAFPSASGDWPPSGGVAGKCPKPGAGQERRGRNTVTSTLC